MARPEVKLVTFEIDGKEVQAPQGTMLVDAAKHGDVEIPYFCYEPKLGQPVGACRMCLVEIEGIPKLQTSCSTPVRDGMVVVTTSDRVRHAQEAVVEFLLVNHPLDCPVCDKGGECPLQDISFGWGAGRSRVIDPKRHFKKPLELSPLVAIDRERCILCYRCVRFSQEVAEDHQLVFLERGDHTFVGTHDGRPYVGPFSGNIIELCPVGALTSTSYRFRARPWDIEDAGSVCALCPSQCNVTLTIRDDAKVVRVLARDNDEVDDGWLCDKGRFGYQSFAAEERITAPMVRDGGSLREVSWERALSDAAAALKRAGAETAAYVSGQTTNEEGFLVQRLMRDGLGSGWVESRDGWLADPVQARTLARPDLAAKVSDIDHADAILVVGTELVDEAPILDLRVRKAVRRNGARLVTLSARPSTLDVNAAAALRCAPRARGGGARRAGRGTRLAPRRGRLPRRAGGASRRRGGLPARGAERERRSAVARRRRAGGSRGARRGRRRGRHLGRAHLGRRARAAGDRGPPGGGHGARAPGQAGIGPDRSARVHQRARAARGGLPAGHRPRPHRRATARRARQGADAAPGGRRRRARGGARAHRHRDRVRSLPRRGARSPRRRGVPGRDLRGEGGHLHAPGRPPAAGAPVARARRAGAPRLERARRAVRAARRRRGVRSAPRP